MWNRGKLCQTMVDSWYCRDRFVPEDMSQVSRRKHKQCTLNTGTSAGTFACLAALQKLQRQSRYEKWTQQVIDIRSKWRVWISILTLRTQDLVDFVFEGFVFEGFRFTLKRWDSKCSSKSKLESSMINVVAVVVSLWIRLNPRAQNGFRPYSESHRCYIFFVSFLGCECPPITGLGGWWAYS